MSETHMEAGMDANAEAPPRHETTERARAADMDDEPRRSSRKDSPTWQKVEAISRVYFTVCRQVARVVNTLDR